jgi:uncharacterized protein
MLIHELTPAQCRDFLARRTVARLACVRANEPYITPISYHFDARADCLYSFSTLGQKIAWMRVNPRVCIEVDDIVDRFNWTTVVVAGHYHELGEAPGDAAELTRARQLFESQPSWWLPGAGQLASGEEHSAPVFFRIAITHATGRTAARPTS